MSPGLEVIRQGAALGHGLCTAFQRLHARRGGSAASCPAAGQPACCESRRIPAPQRGLELREKRAWPPWVSGGRGRGLPRERPNPAREGGAPPCPPEHRGGGQRRGWGPGRREGPREVGGRAGGAGSGHLLQHRGQRPAQWLPGSLLRTTRRDLGAPSPPGDADLGGAQLAPLGLVAAMLLETGLERDRERPGAAAVCTLGGTQGKPQQDTEDTHPQRREEVGACRASGQAKKVPPLCRRDTEMGTVQRVSFQIPGWQGGPDAGLQE